MFVDAVLANVLVFAVGQVFAWLYLRSGRFWLGLGVTAVLWAATDVWLLQRFVLAAPVGEQQWAVWALQTTSFLVVFAYLWARLRKRFAARLRSDRFRQALTHLLRGEPKAAESMFRRLVWSDPWDVPAWIARGDALRRLGSRRSARRSYRRAAGLDTGGKFADLLAHRRVLLQTLPSEKLPSMASAITAKGVTPVARGRSGVGNAVSGN